MTSTRTETALLLTSRQTAEALSISPRKLWSLTATGDIPHVRIGRSVRYAVDDVREWIESQRVTGGTDD